MIRWLCSVSLRKRAAELRQRMTVEAILDVVRRGRLRWYRHVVQKNENDRVKKVKSMNLEGAKATGWPKKVWQMNMSAHIKALGIDHEMAMNHSRWKKAIVTQWCDPVQPIGAWCLESGLKADDDK